MSSLSLRARAAAALALVRKRSNAIEVAAAVGPKIAPETTFLEWVEDLGRNGLLVDGNPFDLSTRPALRAIYEAIPNSKAGGYNRMFSVIKGAQTGATVLTFLLQLYLMLKYEPLKVGSYYPNRSLAAYVSASRFLPVVQSVPVAHKAMLAANGGGEGNVLNRLVGKSEVLFLWTSGSAVTESFPLGAIVADEVQNMLVDDIERIRERMSASDVRFFFACSTAKWPGADIDFLYQKGDQRRFHTECKCDDGVLLDEVFPDCIAYNAGEFDAAGAPRDYVYICPTCRTYVADPQRGRWVPHAPEKKEISFHLPQTLSPTVSAGEVLEAYQHAEDLQNFWNRKLGKPWTDPNQVPITLAICERQVEAGRRAGLTWKDSAQGEVYLGLDQMGGFIVAIVIERMKDGRQALIHTEFLYGKDTWERCDGLMERYGVRTCVVETLPNIDSARAFANRHPGRVFLAGYADLRDDMMVWSDQRSRSDRRTIEEDRSQWTVSLNQYKCMQTALHRIRDGYVLFPDPNGRVQEILDKGQRKPAAVLRTVFHHFTKTALVVKDMSKGDRGGKNKAKPARKMSAAVEKIAIDPHASYAFMLANVAWSRAYGTGMMILPGGPEPAKTDVGKRLQAAVPNLPEKVLAVVETVHGTSPTCAGCRFFVPGRNWCKERGFGTEASAPMCTSYEKGRGTPKE